MRPVLFSTLTKGGDARTFSSVLTHSCHRNITFSCHRNINHSCHRNMALLQVWPWILGFGQLWAALEMETWFGLEGWYGQAVMMGRPSWVGFDGSRICIVLNIEHLPVIHPDENPTKVRTLDGRASVRKSTIVILICFLIPPNPPFPLSLSLSSLTTLCLKRILPSLMSCWLNSLTCTNIITLSVSEESTSSTLQHLWENPPFYWDPLCTQALHWGLPSIQTWCPLASCRCPCPRTIGPCLWRKKTRLRFFKSYQKDF